MKELELVITEGAKAGGDTHSVELGIPTRDPVERDGEQFILLSARCRNLAEFEDEIKSAIAKLQELRLMAKANFARWNHEARKN